MDNKYETRANGRIVALRTGSWGPTGTVRGYVAHDRWSLRKSEMVRKSGVLFAASTRKAMSSWSRWAMRRDYATPTQWP